MAETSEWAAHLDGFAEFYRMQFARTVQAVRPIVGESAADVAQEAFIVALRQWDHVAGLQSPESWVCFVARRMARRRRHREATRPSAERAGELTRVGRRGVDIDVHVAVQDLPSRQQAAIRLHYFCDRSVDEVAELLHCLEPTARVLLHRARQRLAEPLSGLSGTWVGERQWTSDETVRQLEHVGDERYRDAILANVGAQGVRRVLKLDDGAYLLANDDGERLDHGTFGVRGGALELTPWSGGVVVFRTTVDGGIVRFRQLSNTTSPTGGTPDHVYMRLLLESEPFVWSNLADGGSVPPDGTSPT